MTRMRPMPTFVPYAYILPDAVVEWLPRDMPAPGYPVGFYNIGDGKLLRPVKAVFSVLLFSRPRIFLLYL